MSRQPWLYGCLHTSERCFPSSVFPLPQLQAPIQTAYFLVLIQHTHARVCACVCVRACIRVSNRSGLLILLLAILGHVAYCAVDAVKREISVLVILRTQAKDDL